MGRKPLPAAKQMVHLTIRIRRTQLNPLRAICRQEGFYRKGKPNYSAAIRKMIGDSDK